MLNKEKLEKLKKEARENHIPILQDSTMQVIKTILAIKKPNKVLEIGTAVGYSALCFSEYLSDDNSVIKTVEINEEIVNIAKNNIKEISDKNNIEVTNMDAYEYMQTLNEKFDVVFIDAAKGQYMKYLKEAYRLTDKGSIIIADNVLLRGMVMSDYNEHKHRTAVTRLREYIKEVTENEMLETVVLDIGDGLAISVRKEEQTNKCPKIC